MNDFSSLNLYNEPACPLCKVDHPSCKLKYKKYGFSIYRCGVCSIMFVNPLPSMEKIFDIYKSSYFQRGNKYNFNHKIKISDPNWHNDVNKISFVKNFKSSGTLLDVGCGMGGFLNVARESGFTVTGIEISKYASDFVKSELEMMVYNTDLSTAGFRSESYDIVCMWDVIEHLHDPHKTLQEIYRILKPGGYLFISTGDTGSIWARITGYFWHLLTPPQHLFYFNKKNLNDLLVLKGFDVIKTIYDGKCVTLEFIVFKLIEAVGPVFHFLKIIITKLGLNKKKITINLHDIMTTVARK